MALNRDDVIRMAREAGMLPVYFNRTSFETELSAYPKELERFFQAAYAAGAAAEREACAKLCLDAGLACEVRQGADLCFDLSEAIRARGQA